MNLSKFALVLPRPADNLPLVDADPVERVRSGYNAISRAYRSDDEVTSQQFVPEGDGGHALFWAQTRQPGTPQAGAVGGR